MKDYKNYIDEFYTKISEQDGINKDKNNKEMEEKIALSLGYTIEDIKTGANLGLGCGNPIENANLKEGETVLDLGSGRGMDVFKASRIVGDKV